MQIFFAGAETPTLRRRSTKAGATRVAASFWGLSERIPRNEKKWDGWLAKRFPDDVEIFLDSGGFTANRNPDRLDDDEWIEYQNSFMDFVAVNHERISLVTEFDFTRWHLHDIKALREQFFDDLGEKFVPVWHLEHGLPELENLAQRYDIVAIPPDALKSDDHDQIITRMGALARMYGTAYLGLAMTRLDYAPLFDYVSSTAWVAPTRYGDTIFWDGERLHWHPKSQREQIRSDLASEFERAGFNSALIEQDDPEELTRLTVWSLLQWEGTQSDVLGPEDAQVSGSDAQQAPSSPDTSPGTALKFREDGERSLLPILESSRAKKLVERDGKMVEEEGDPTLAVRGRSLRQCNTCFVKTFCPAFEPDAGCAYDIPVQIQTKDQLTSLINGLLEIQGQRVLFSRFSEELEGGAPSKATSVELDRFFALTEKARDIQDDRSFMRLSVETRGSTGVLSRLFGSQVGEAQRELPAPVDGDEVIADVLDEV